MMNRFLHICLAVMLAIGFAGRYNDFDEPAKAKVWTDADFDGQIISIRNFKQLFYDAYGTAGLSKTLEITDDYVIKGKVISSDQAGNVYKSVYIMTGQQL